MRLVCAEHEAGWGLCVQDMKQNTNCVAPGWSAGGNTCCAETNVYLLLQQLYEHMCAAGG
jgi:hypothetical protein